jgi:maleylacetate reductase
MSRFIYQALPTRVLFDVPHREVIQDEVARLGMKAPLVITGAQQSSLGAALGFMHWDGAKMHTPVVETERALEFFNDRKADGIISLGGGSAIGLGKALALRTDAPQICIPTSFAGSEMTNILGETTATGKATKRDAKIQPETVIYDPALLASLPPAFAATSGMNAIAHAVEGLYAVDGNPIISLMAEEAIAALASALPQGPSAYKEAFYGAWLCGTILGSAAMALHHKLCHVLGGTFGLPHAETHTVILPHATAYNAGAAPEAMIKIQNTLQGPPQSFGQLPQQVEGAHKFTPSHQLAGGGARRAEGASAARGLFDLATTLNAPTSLKQLGLAESALDQAADIAVANPYPNPQKLTRDGIRQLLENAFHGHRPD